ncbi:MAG: BMP family ABC transporter substrate-binding protein [Lachnospiraceae bacterium]|nr:BMP family ABC transporter substrate-binding protein [Lachnospiraceae bacterium]
MMGSQEYLRALKLGDKEYKACVSKGIYPYLPVLDDLVSRVDIETQVPLGLVEIPIKSIVGTYSAGRTTAFARNFMPILEPDSEFSAKWGQLYDSLEEDGLRDPIKAFEFNNRFYVMEGNKRVSVFKYMDAVSIEGTVTRMIPKRSDDPEVKIYYEFMDFYDLTGINYLYMSREGNFRKLLKYTYGLDTKWEKEQEQDFRAFFTFFEKEFAPKAAGKLTITAGDALCVYLSIFGYKEAAEKTQAEIRRDIARLWNEFVNYNSGAEMTLVLNPTPESQKTALVKLLPGASTLKIAFIHDRSAQQSAWTYSHELGRKYVQDALGERIATTAVDRVEDQDADDVFDAAIEAGHKVIFATSPKLMPAAVRAAVKHPEVIILNCSMSLGHKTIRSYYLRNYEAKFILGAIAGAMKDEGNIGYLADYPIHGSTAEINAFAMGVQMTCHDAKVYLEWSTVKDRDPYAAFRENNVTLISGRDMNAKDNTSREFGLYALGKEGRESEHTSLAMPVRHWGKLYAEIIRTILRGAYKNDENVFADQALNYFWGMSSEAVDVIYSRNLPAGPVRLLRSLRAGMRDMDINPLIGPVYAQDGSLKCEDGQVITAKDAVNIDWLAENIIGELPDISQLKEEAVELVSIQGIKSEV